MKPDVVYRVRAGEKNEKLRYSLRTLRNLDHGRVFIAGYKPSWVSGVTHIPAPVKGEKWANIVTALRLACEQAGEWFVLMDDDYYVMQSTSLRPLHRSTLAEHIVATTGPYKRSLQATADYLRERGIAEPLSYELHIPMLVNSRHMASAIDAATAGRPLQVRSLYGNLWPTASDAMADVKIRSRQDPLPVGPFLSTGSLRLVEPLLTARFLEPSPYEAVAA